MNKLVPFLLFIAAISNFTSNTNQFISRQGQISFFSYTSVENIEAVNNQVLSIFDLDKSEIAVSMLMRAFVFKKDLMYEHFNESYVESDMHPKATFEGKIIDFDKKSDQPQTKIIRGSLTIHGVSKIMEVKTTITKEKNKYVFTGDFNASVDDFQIKIPPILSSNIAKIISIKFRFQYEPYQE